MSRMKLTVVGAVVAALALSVSAAAASAHEYKSGGSPVTTVQKLKAHLFAGVFVLTGKPFTVSIHVECTKVQESGSIEGGGKGSATLEFRACTTSKPANCTVKEPITTEVLTNLTGGPPVENEFAPKNGKTFTTITFEGASCALKSKPVEVTGSQLCTMPSGETELVAHELACKASGSKLEAGSAKAEFEGSINGLELESGAEWSAH